MSKQKVLNVQGVKKLILRPGDGPQAVTGAHVIFHYNGTLEDGTSFGSSYDSNPIDVTIGSGKLSSLSNSELE
jgi:FKBP-type peptidyl-prolyl cis-trans isomerase